MVGPGDADDAAATEELIGDLLDKPTTTAAATTVGIEVGTIAGVDGAAPAVAATATAAVEAAVGAGEGVGRAGEYGDNAYGTDEFQDRLDRAGIGSGSGSGARPSRP